MSRESLDKLSQRGQLLSEEGHSAGKGGRRSTQLLTSHQNLLRTTKERLRSCQLALQEHEALEEATQSMWARVKDVQDRLAGAESTLGNKETLEGRLSQIQVRAAHSCCSDSMCKSENWPQWSRRCRMKMWEMGRNG